jgi:hypothetical protein
MKRLIAALLLGLSLTACGHTDKRGTPQYYPPVKTVDGGSGVSCSAFETVYEVTSARTTNRCVHLLPGAWTFSVPAGKTQGCEIKRYAHANDDVADDLKLTAGQKSSIILREGNILLPTGWCDGKWNHA